MTVGQVLQAAARLAAGQRPEVPDLDACGPGILVHRSEHHGLAPAAHLLVRDHPGLPPELGDRLAAAYHRGVRTHLLAMDALGFLDEVLHHLPWAVVKGPALADLLYPRPDLRCYVDLDVVVPRVAFPGAIDALEAAGARVTDRSWVHLVEQRPGEVRMQLPSGLLLDLHWHLLNRPNLRAAFPLPVDDWVERAETVRMGGVDARVLRPEEQLLHLALHSCLAGGDRLVWTVDLHHAARAVRDWDEVLSSARRCRAVLPLAVALDRSARSVGVEVPDPFLDELWRSARSWRRIVRFAELVRPLEEETGAPSVRRIVTRATRPTAGAGLVELGQRLAAAAGARRRSGQSVDGGIGSSASETEARAQFCAALVDPGPLSREPARR